MIDLLSAMRLLISALLFSLSVSACNAPDPPPSSIEAVPEWAQGAIWYQIFVERFNNGNPANDPRLEDIEGSWPHLMPEGFAPTRWTSDWFEQEEWAKDTGEPFYLTVQSRRYGGDLQGVMEKLDYLDSLGVTALYLNPINDAPSLHKFDARNYHHIDRNFGRDPEADLRAMADENPVDPATWVTTSADSLFFALIDAAHDRGMKVVIDVSWNHTGIRFWAWQDVLENQAASPYADWYRIEQLDDPATPENEFAYRGWAGVPELPELRKVGVPEGYDGGAEEGDLNPGAKAHIMDVTRRWLDPNGDGDPSDGVDGFRLDVAEKVPLGFWRDYLAFVRAINPAAYLVGEIWWEDWPHRMFDPKPWLGDVFDAVMNYRWYMPTRSLFAQAEPFLTPTQWVAHLDSVQSGISEPNLRSLMNLTASHDSPRFSTSMQNRQGYKTGMSRRDNKALQVSRPDEETRRSMQLLLVQQFTWIGSPHIWNGDELGMWGADDPDNRKPIWWPELRFDPEKASPDDVVTKETPVAGDMEWLSFYRDLVRLRKSNLQLLSHGATEEVVADDENGLLSYVRTLEGERIEVVFNLSTETRYVRGSEPRIEYQVGGAHVKVEGESFRLVLPPRSVAVYR